MRLPQIPETTSALAPRPRRRGGQVPAGRAHGCRKDRCRAGPPQRCASACSRRRTAVSRTRSGRFRRRRPRSASASQPRLGSPGRPARAGTGPRSARRFRGGHDVVEPPSVGPAYVHVLDEAKRVARAAEVRGHVENRMLVHPALDHRVHLHGIPATAAASIPSSTPAPGSRRRSSRWNVSSSSESRLTVTRSSPDARAPQPSARAATRSSSASAPRRAERAARSDARRPCARAARHP